MSKCCGDTDWEACIGGFVYGPCEYEQCGGVCMLVGPCPCPCHKEVPRD